MSASSQDGGQSAQQNKPRAKISEAELTAETQTPQFAAAAGSQAASAADNAVNALRYRAGGDLATASVAQQAAQLTKTPLGKIQRQQLLREIGRVQGNAHVQRLVNAVGDSPGLAESRPGSGAAGAMSGRDDRARDEEEQASDLSAAYGQTQISPTPTAADPAASPQSTMPDQSGPPSLAGAVHNAGREAQAATPPPPGGAARAPARQPNGAGPQSAAGNKARAAGAGNKARTAGAGAATVQGAASEAAPQRDNVDFTARIEQFIQEARSGATIGESGTAQGDTRPSTVSGDTTTGTIQRYSPEPDRPVNFAGFDATLDDQRRQIMQISAANHAQIGAAVTSEQQRFTQNRTAAQAELSTNYDLALASLSRAHEGEAASIQEHLAAVIERLTATASAQSGVGLANVAARQAAAVAAGEERAAQAETVGAQRSLEVSAGSEQKASAALVIGNEKAAQHSSSEYAGEISQLASAAAGQTAGEIRQTGQTLAAAAVADMGALAAKLRREAGELATQLDAFGNASAQYVEEDRQAAVVNAQQVADDALRQLSTAHDQTVAELAATHSQAQSQLVQETAGVQAALQQAGDDADLKIDENAAMAIATLEGQAAAIRPQFTGQLGAQAQADLDQATSAMTTVAPQYAATMEGAVGEVTQAMAQQTDAADDRVNTFTSDTLAAYAAAATQFETDALSIGATAQGEMTRLADEGVDNITKETSRADAAMAGIVAEATGEWDSELTQGLGELEAKLQRGVAEQDAALANLAREIDSQAAAIDNRGVLEVIGEALSAVGSLIASAVRAVATVMVAAIAAVVAVALAVVALAVVAVLVVAAVAVAVAAVVVAVAVAAAALLAVVATAIVALGVLAVAVVAAVFVLLALLPLLVALVELVALFIVVTALIPIVLKWLGISSDFFGTDFDAGRDLNVNRFDPEGEGSRDRVEDIEGGLDPDRPTIVIVHGWNNTEAEAWMMDIARAEHNAACAGQPEPCQGPQILIVGWGAGANTLLPYWTSHNIPAAGQELGRRLTQDYGLQPENVRFVGHSFGTYVANEAGRAMGGAAGITALDPADDLVGLNLFSRPDTDFDQNFGESEAIHTSPIAGNQTEHSDRDFYADTEEGIIDNIADWMSGGHSIVDEPDRHSEAQNVYIRYLEERANRGPDYRLGDYMRERRDSENVTGYFEDGQERDIRLTNVDRDGGPSEM